MEGKHKEEELEEFTARSALYIHSYMYLSFLKEKLNYFSSNALLV